VETHQFFDICLSLYVSHNFSSLTTGTLGMLLLIHVLMDNWFWDQKVRSMGTKM